MCLHDQLYPASRLTPERAAHAGGGGLDTVTSTIKVRRESQARSRSTCAQGTIKSADTEELLAPAGILISESISECEERSGCQPTLGVHKASLPPGTEAEVMKSVMAHPQPHWH